MSAKLIQIFKYSKFLDIGNAINISFMADGSSDDGIIGIVE